MVARCGALRQQPSVAKRVNAIFVDHDVLLSPVTAARPEPVERWRGAGAIRTFNAGGPYVTYTAIWNYLGHPAATVRAGFDANGLPTAIQIIAPTNVRQRCCRWPHSSSEPVPGAMDKPPSR